MDADSGRVLYSQNADARMRIASTTKLMTALVAIRHADLDMVCTVGRDAAGVEGSSMYLKAGEKLTLETLLYGLLLSSGNDAAVAIADAVAGDVSSFVALMNETAAELGMTNSSFANPNGLDAEGHYSTALDMAKLGRAAAADPTLLRIASTRSVTIGGRTLTNHNKLLSYRADCVGLRPAIPVPPGGPWSPARSGTASASSPSRCRTATTGRTTPPSLTMASLPTPQRPWWPGARSWATPGRRARTSPCGRGQASAGPPRRRRPSR